MLENYWKDKRVTRTLDALRNHLKNQYGAHESVSEGFTYDRETRMFISPSGATMKKMDDVAKHLGLVKPLAMGKSTASGSFSLPPSINEDRSSPEDRLTLNDQANDSDTDSSDENWDFAENEQENLDSGKEGGGGAKDSASGRESTHIGEHRARNLTRSSKTKGY